MARSLAAKRGMMSRTRTISTHHNVPLTNLAAEQIDFLHFIIHLQHTRYSHYPQILLTSQFLLLHLLN